MGRTRIAGVEMWMLVLAELGPVAALAAASPTLQPLSPATTGDLHVTSSQSYSVGAGTYELGNVYVYDGGVLQFEDAVTDFWANSILVESTGTLAAGTPTAPIGTAGGLLTIHLYGTPSDTPIACQTDAQCGVPTAYWPPSFDTACTTPYTPASNTYTIGSTTVDDLFYPYCDLPAKPGDDAGLFGRKVFAVSYGGTVTLYGKKGASYSTPSQVSGTSWARLDKSLAPGDTSLTLDRAVDWQVGDRVVVTSTDYLPGHAEVLTVSSVSADGKTLGFTRVADAGYGNPDPGCSGSGVCYPHNGAPYSLSGLPASLGIDQTGVDTRAAVGLLSRSIRIVSGGAAAGDAFPAVADSDCTGGSQACSFGGHLIVRQGVAGLALQGVEIYQLGQGGLMARYPVHFHLARATDYAEISVADGSIHDSMTRWIAVHGTQGLTLARNVGYASIGHGYYLEDGSEVDNTLSANLGVLARAGVQNQAADGSTSPNPMNPRAIPGILADTADTSGNYLSTMSDVVHPSVFWIANGANSFTDNLAAGAATCGACYWIVPMAVSGSSTSQSWTGNASIQVGTPRAGLAPLSDFSGNACAGAQHSINVVGGTGECAGVTLIPANAPGLEAIENPYDADYEYPDVSSANSLNPTLCADLSGDCSTAATPPCASGTGNCDVAVIDGFTSSFHWANTNFSAVWLRPHWYLFNDSALTDVQNGGLSMISGGDYTEAIDGYWALTRKSVFVGVTQPGNGFADPAGPINPTSGLTCDSGTQNGLPYCLVSAQGVAYPRDNFAVNQRFFNIYDGPVYQESNAYLDIPPSTIDCDPTNGICSKTDTIYATAMGVPKDPDDGSCYLPNAAIAWKQPNGFYYPPAFHSANLYFDDVVFRHFVIEPPFEPGTLTIDPAVVEAGYCTYPPKSSIDPDAPAQLFSASFTDVDRQTILNDDDGSLTGLVGTTSINNDAFFLAPVQVPECGSCPAGGTCATQPAAATVTSSPYQYATTVVFPGSAVLGTSSWSLQCETTSCYGVPLYRQLLTASEQQAGATPSIRMMGAGIGQRSSLTLDGGSYYIDTTVSLAEQTGSGAANVNVFEPNQTYYVFQIFATADSSASYQLYVGPGFDTSTQLQAVTVDASVDPPTFTPTSFPPAWSQSYDGATGLLTVTVDMSGYEDEYAAARQAACGPASFCAWSNGTCSCALPSTDPRYAACSDAGAGSGVGSSLDACSWASKAVPCPQGGCLGFAFTTTAGFDTSTDPRPAPVCFPDAPPWNVSFDLAPASVAGSDCTYPSQPASTEAFCPPGS